MSNKKFLLLVGLLVSFFVGYGATAKGYPYPPGMYGRPDNYGYFTNSFATGGTNVLPSQYAGESFPSSMNSAAEFIGFIKGGEGLGGNSQQRTGAAFIIQTMIGSARNRPPTAAQIAEWEARVNYMQSQGDIIWRGNFRYNINSYYQGPSGGGGNNDDAFYDEWGTFPAVMFTNGAGGVYYAIKWECANPVGYYDLNPIPDTPNFNITGRTTVSNPSPLPGETIQFRHYVRNTGPGNTSPTQIWWLAQDMPAQTTTGGPASSGTYAAGQEKNVYNENVVIPGTATPGTQYCQRVGWDPVNGTGGSNGRGVTVCATVRYDFTLTPLINFTVNGAAPTSSVVEQGDSIVFTYAVNNSGPTLSQPATCTIYGLTRTGSYAEPTPADSVSDPGYTPPPTGCPRTFPGNGTTTTLSNTETITATTANRTICRSLWLSPATETGGSVGEETCIRVVARPYLKVYGGDVAAGGGLETAPDTCTNNTNAAITGWNKRNTALHAGAGAQYAVFAMGAITDFASGRDNAVGDNMPVWLSFSNTLNVNTSTGLYGGLWGSASCINDYYAQRPATTSPLPVNITSMITDTYGATGAVALVGGNVNPGERISVFIDGDVTITSNITYISNWNYDNVPLFELIVRGNIYISSGVTRLDGMYIAQRNGASGGTIYTCATGSTPITLTNGAFYNTCNSKLVINGAFIANSVEFLRTAGTLSQSIVNEPINTSTAAEVFNFNPSLWMVQPVRNDGLTANYDAITGLPPVL